MPHIVIEYSANLRDQLDLPAFLAHLHSAALETGIFTPGGVRTRAHASEDYVIADGHPENIFVHILAHIGHGRDLATRQRVAKAIFTAAKEYLAPLADHTPLGLSFELTEIDPQLSFRANNLHDYVEQRRNREVPE